jgi:hypothetical protein
MTTAAASGRVAEPRRHHRQASPRGSKPSPAFRRIDQINPAGSAVTVFDLKYTDEIIPAVECRSGRAAREGLILFHVISLFKKQNQIFRKRPSLSLAGSVPS